MAGTQILEQSKGWTNGTLRSSPGGKFNFHDVLYHMWSSDLSTQLVSQVLELKYSYLILIRSKDRNHITKHVVFLLKMGIGITMQILSLKFRSFQSF